MKIVRIRTEEQEIAYGGVEPEGIRVLHGVVVVQNKPVSATRVFNHSVTRMLLEPGCKGFIVGSKYGIYSRSVYNCVISRQFHALCKCGKIRLVQQLSVQLPGKPFRSQGVAVRWWPTSH